MAPIGLKIRKKDIRRNFKMLIVLSSYKVQRMDI